MCRPSSPARRSAWLLLAIPILLAACAAPPNKEIGDAQTALKAAQAAGAEQYASESYAAAADAYRRANEAVLAGDYRLALNLALESRDYSQTASRQAADLNVRARDDVQRAITDAATMLAQAVTKLEAAERANVTHRSVREARQTVARVSDDVQKAGTALRAGNYVAAKPLLAKVNQTLLAVIAELDKVTPAQSRRPRP